MSADILEVPGGRLTEVVRGARLAVVPFGSVEYHGPHGPLGTDCLVADELARRVAGRLGGVRFPLVAYTHCFRQTARFPGTVSVRAEALVPYIEDVFRGVFAAGFPGLLALNGHSDNTPHLHAAAERLGEDFAEGSEGIS